MATQVFHHISLLVHLHKRHQGFLVELGVILARCELPVDVPLNTTFVAVDPHHYYILKVITRTHFDPAREDHAFLAEVSEHIATELRVPVFLVFSASDSDKNGGTPFTVLVVASADPEGKAVDWHPGQGLLQQHLAV